MSLQEAVLQTVTRTHDAARDAATLSMSTKEKLLVAIAGKLRDRRAYLQEENRKDLEAGKAAGLSAAMLDRLTLSDKVIDQTASGLEEIAAFPDPVGEIVPHVGPS